MKLESIDERTLKVVLTAADLEVFGVTYESLDQSGAKTKEIITEIIAQAKSELDVNLSLGRLFVEAYPYADGGCILYINRISTEPKKQYRMGFDTPLIYAFKDINALCELALRMRNAYNHIIIKDALYFCEHKGEYYLIVYTYFKLDDKLTGLLSEYGRFCGKGSLSQALVREHSREIINSDALLILSGL